jgi:hypothetical protein
LKMINVLGDHHQKNDRKCWKNSRPHPWRLSLNNQWAHGYHWDELRSLPGDLNRRFENAQHWRTVRLLTDVWKQLHLNMSLELRK